jgi:hypothetical protein
MTSTHTIIIQALLGIIQMGNLASGVVPPKWQPVVLGAVALLQIAQAWLAHKYNPDGTTALVAYVPKSKT